MVREALSRSGRSVAAGAAAALTALLLAACGSSSQALKGEDVEKVIAAGIYHHSGIPTRVSCPTRVPSEAGYRFSCTVALQAGSYPVAVVVKNANGTVRYESHEPFVALDTKKVQAAIVASIARERKVGATVRCPAYVLQHQGVTFTCSAQIIGRPGSYPFTVTETNGEGHVKYVGR